MPKARKNRLSYRLNVALRHIAKELLRGFYHFVYRPLKPGYRFYCRNIFEGTNSLIFSNGGSYLRLRRSRVDQFG